MELEKRKKFISLLHQIKSYNITPNQFFILLYYDGGGFEMELSHLDIRMLSMKGFLFENKITPLGKVLLNNISITDKIKCSKEEINSDEFLSNIPKYIEIFPKMTLPSGKLARVAANNLIGGFKWFFERYTYSWDTIFLATERYVKEFEMKKYMYMQTSQYFLRKQSFDKTWNSELANYCAVIESGEDELPELKDKVV